MRTDDKVIAGTNTSIDDNVNTRDQMRVGIWFAVVFVLAIIGLFSLGDSHAPVAHNEEPQDTSGTGANPVNRSENPPRYDVNRPVGVIEWPGQVGHQTKYLTGHGNSPAVESAAPKTGVSTGVSPNTATDEASRMKAKSGATPSDSMPTQGSPTATTTQTSTAGGGTYNSGGH